MKSKVVSGKNMRLTFGMLKLKSFVRSSLVASSPGSLAAIVVFAAGFIAVYPLAAQRPERAVLDITAYVIDAEIDTTAHHLKAKATVTFTAPENSEMISFGFHPALKVTKITDDSGKVLTGERSADGTIRVTPASPLVCRAGCSLDLRVRRHDHRCRRRPRRRPQARRHPGAHHLPPLCRALVPYHGLHDRSLHR